jgi:hypothetical protein
VLQYCQETGDLGLAAKVLAAISSDLQRAKSLVTQQVSVLLLLLTCFPSSVPPPPRLFMQTVQALTDMLTRSCWTSSTGQHNACRRRSRALVPSCVGCTQALISLLQSCRLTGDVDTARALADFHLRTFSLQDEDIVGSTEDPRGFQEQFLRFCAQEPRQDELAVAYLKRLLFLDGSAVASGQLFGEYISMLVTGSGVHEASAVVDALALEPDFDGWPWISAIRRVGTVSPVNTRIGSFNRPIGGSDARRKARNSSMRGSARSSVTASKDDGAESMLTLLRTLYVVAGNSVLKSTPKSAESPVWDTLVDAYVMSLTRQVCAGVPLTWRWRWRWRWRWCPKLVCVCALCRVRCTCAAVYPCSCKMSSFSCYCLHLLNWPSQGFLVEALSEFHGHVHEGFSFELSASPLLRKLLEVHDSVISTSDALSVYMFLASRDEAFQLTSRHMLQRLHSEGRVDDMLRVYKALVSTGNVLRLSTDAHLNRLLVALVSKQRYVVRGSCRCNSKRRAV